MEDATEPPNQNPRLIVTGEGEQSLPVFPGQRVVKVNGTYLQSNELRNGKHCYSKIEREKKDLEKESSSSSSHQVEEQVEGGIYFLRGYWRLCEIGIGEDVIGWDYSQLPTDPESLEPPFGRWVYERSLLAHDIEEEEGIDYSKLEVNLESVAPKPAKRN